MRFLKWYSAIVSTLGVLACIITGVTQASAYPEYASSNLWGAVIYTPIAVYLWTTIRR